MLIASKCLMRLLKFSSRQRMTTMGFPFSPLAWRPILARYREVYESIEATTAATDGDSPDSLGGA